MPSSYTMDTLPVPKNTDLEIKEVPAHSVAALTFFGAITQASCHVRTQNSSQLNLEAAVVWSSWYLNMQTAFSLRQVPNNNIVFRKRFERIPWSFVQVVPHQESGYKRKLQS